MSPHHKPRAFGGADGTSIAAATARQFPSFVTTSAADPRGTVEPADRRRAAPQAPFERTLVVAVDLDDSAEHILRAAAELAQLFRAKVFVVHAVSDVAFLSPRAMRRGASSPIVAARKHGEGVLGWCRLQVVELTEHSFAAATQTEVVVRRGEAARVVQDLMNEVNPELLIVGRTRARGWSKRWRRGVGEAICRKTNTTTIMLPRRPGRR